jgi:hypothetical protein
VLHPVIVDRFMDASPGKDRAVHPDRGRSSPAQYLCRVTAIHGVGTSYGNRSSIPQYRSRIRR